MKILFLLDDFPTDGYSSASIIVYNMAKKLLKDGHNISIITSTRDKSKQGKENYNGLEIFRIFSSYPSFFKNWMVVYNFQIISKLKKLIREINPDICHFHHIHQYLSYYSLRLAKKYSKAIFITTHDVAFIHYGKLMPINGNYIYKVSIRDQIKEAGRTYNPLRNLFIRYFLKSVNKIFTVSNSLKDFLKINGINNTETIYNGINVDSWKPNIDGIKKFKEKYNIKQKKVLFFGGRISRAKGGDQVIKFLVEIKKTVKDILLIVVGEENKYVQHIKLLIKD